jgi:hypothetical protein
LLKNVVQYPLTADAGHCARKYYSKDKTKLSMHKIANYSACTKIRLIWETDT